MIKSHPSRSSPNLALIAAITGVIISTVTNLAATPVSAEGRLFFENKIRPALATHCYECHSADAKELGAKLLLDSRDGLRNGGESGPAIVPGKPEKSLIIQAVRRTDEHRMPPENPLPDTIVHDLVEWIKNGAPDPRSESARHPSDTNPSSSNHWAFQPIANPSPPDVHATAWPLDPLDHFVLNNIESAKQAPSKDARPETLIRRLHYDLLGLPPLHEEIVAFVADHASDSQKAIVSLVDRLLASPHFGERWGRHWLDIARYGESNGNDGLGRNPTFPNAWRYRDYVIAALNRDIPYDRFLTEQIAGDLLPFETAEQRNRQLTATGFLAIGAKPAAAMNNNFAMDVVDDQINVVSTATMGLSVACARCHDHKHDPIPTREYYAMAGIFKSTETLWGAAANEKLTAPPTPLHELRPNLDPGSPVSLGSLPEFLSTYSAAIDNLNPLVHANFATTPSDVILEKGITPQPAGYADTRDGRIRLETPLPADAYTISFWFRNDTGNNARPITAYLFSHAADGDNDQVGAPLGIGGSHDKNWRGSLYV
ncbi:MAG: DUF1549 domain-containing protein, partial [Verrucomicrobiales bacterium]|nr:DUF1549 domain-containing protein [Verrucomicrobiales bacterium]